MVLASQSTSLKTGSRILSILAILSAIVAASYLLYPSPLADAFFAGWVLVSIILPLIGGIGVWTNRPPVVWISALFHTGLSIIGMWSIGLFIAPAAFFLLGAAVLSTWGPPRRDVGDVITAEPLSIQATVVGIVGGSGSAALGGWLVYRGAIAQELFGACARETVTCALTNTHWDAVGMTLFGLLAVGLGSWLVWTQLSTARLLAAKQIG